MGRLRGFGFGGVYMYAPRRRARRYHQIMATAAARQVWNFLYPGEKFGLTVYFAHCGRGRLGDYAMNVVRLNLTLLQRSPNEIVSTLIHEFQHHRNKKMRHGDAFDRLVIAQCDRIGVRARVEELRIGRRELRRQERAAFKRAAERNET